MQKLQEISILMDKLKILHVLSYNGKGGAETLVENLINLQLKSSSSKFVHVLTFSSVYKSLRFSSCEKNFKHYHLYVNSRFSIIRFSKIFMFFFKVFFNNSYHIINTHLLAPLYIFLFPLFLNKTNYVHTFHSQAEKELGSYKYSIHYYVRHFYYSRINLVSISKSVKKSINLLYGFKSKLILNGAQYQKKSTKISEEFYKKKSNKKILLAVGHTRKVKNYELLINSFKKFKDDCTLIILGSLVDNFKNYDIISEKKNSIYFMGAVQNVQDYMKFADFLCMTSKYEGMPITLLEAKANGLIPIVTPVRGITDLVERNHNGIISKDLKVKSFELAIQEALNLSHKQKNLFITNSKKEFKHLYSIDICCENYLNYYKFLHKSI